jgi:hypothetical protein
MNTVINAFHPDYMKTYEPNFTKEFRTVEANQNERIKTHVKVKSKKKKMSYKVPKKTPILTKKEQGKSMGEIHNELAELKKRILAPRVLYTYSKAGMPKGVH